jgi:hypothetical protein
MNNLSIENIAQIWNQLPDQNKRMLQERLFFLALQKVGGIRHELDTGVGDSSGAIGGRVCPTILSLPSGTQPGEPEAPISISRPSESLGVAS